MIIITILILSYRVFAAGGRRGSTRARGPSATTSCHRGSSGHVLPPRHQLGPLPIRWHHHHMRVPVHGRPLHHAGRYFSPCLFPAAHAVKSCSCSLHMPWAGLEPPPFCPRALMEARLEGCSCLFGFCRTCRTLNYPNRCTWPVEGSPARP
jgi:hypothetical protein